MHTRVLVEKGDVNPALNPQMPVIKE